jgi:hypothetical protein
MINGDSLIEDKTITIPMGLTVLLEVCENSAIQLTHIFKTGIQHDG